MSAPWPAGPTASSPPSPSGPAGPSTGASPMSVRLRSRPVSSSGQPSRVWSTTSPAVGSARSAGPGLRVSTTASAASSSRTRHDHGGPVGRGCAGGVAARRPPPRVACVHRVTFRVGAACTSATASASAWRAQQPRPEVGLRDGQGLGGRRDLELPGAGATGGAARRHTAQGVEVAGQPAVDGRRGVDEADTERRQPLDVARVGSGHERARPARSAAPAPRRLGSTLSSPVRRPGAAQQQVVEAAGAVAAHHEHAAVGVVDRGVGHVGGHGAGRAAVERAAGAGRDPPQQAGHGGQQRDDHEGRTDRLAPAERLAGELGPDAGAGRRGRGDPGRLREQQRQAEPDRLRDARRGRGDRDAAERPRR